MQVALASPNTRFRLPARLAGRDSLPTRLLWQVSKLLIICSPAPGFAWRTAKVSKQASAYEKRKAESGFGDEPV